MTDVQDVVQKLEGTDQFKKFKEQEPARYLVHVFMSKGKTEIGYYDKEKDTIVVFEMDPFVQRPEESVFKESGILEKLDIAKVVLGVEGIKEKIRAIQEEKYAQHPIQQEILILQQQEQPVWSCTLVTQTLNMLLLKIDAVSGDILSEELRNILDLRQ